MDRHEQVHIFLDNSNIFVSARQVAEERDWLLAPADTRLHVENLHRLARSGRDVAKAVCGGSPPMPHRRRLESLGYLVEEYPRHRVSRREVAVDHAIQTHMRRSLRDSAPAVAVLLSGDGNGYLENRGFLSTLKDMRSAGWGVEVLAWDHSCNKALQTWARSYGAYIPLDDYYETVTFIEGSRRAMPLSLTRRQTAVPRRPPPQLAA